MWGWLGYYAVAEMKNDMERWNEWLRRRIRIVYSISKEMRKQWKLPSTRVENLKKLGMPEWMVYRNGNTRKGYWVVAGSGILSHTITNERLARRGYYDISEAYKSLHYLRLNRRVQIGTHGGVRGRLINQWSASYSIKICGTLCILQLKSAKTDQNRAKNSKITGLSQVGKNPTCDSFL